MAALTLGLVRLTVKVSGSSTRASSKIGTVIVAVDTTRRHPIYNKNIKRTKKYYAHDEKNECRIGDSVQIEETRPLSKMKRWRVREIIVKGKVADIKPSEISN